MLLNWLTIVIGTVGTLLPIANPFSTAPVFASLTRGYSRADRNRQARRASVYMASVLLVTLFVGVMILTFFGIGMSALRIAGGLLVARIGFSMANPDPQEIVSETDTNEAMHKEDIAFMPIAMPLLSGPGSMAATISMASVADGPEDYLGVAIGIVMVSIISWLILRSSTLVASKLGVTGMNVLTRVMGFLLVCIGIQFVATGFFEGLTDQKVMGPIVEAVRQAAGT